MKILSAAQTRQADAFTIANEPILSIDLMERAARKLYFWFKENLRHKPEIWIFCGKGNNGGDGLALSRMLLLTGWKVETFIVEHSENVSDDFKVNLERLKSLKSKIRFISSVSDFPSPKNEIVVVDAMLGSGLNKPLRGLILDLVLNINALKNFKVGIDIPTGLFAETNSQNNLRNVLKCDFTLTFQAPKYSFLFPETGVYVGQFDVLDIGLHPKFLKKIKSENYFLTEKDIERIFKPKTKFDHKGTNGHAVLVGGSLGKIGAIGFSAKACLKAGAGLVTVQIPKSGISALQNFAPEIMSGFEKGENILEEIKIEGNKTYGFGPGMGTDIKTQNALLAALKKLSVAVVIDADALNILSLTKAWDLPPANSILTPHLGELARITGVKAFGIEALNLAKEFSKKYNLIVVLKGAHTAIALPTGETFFNSTGNAGMATAGSGDVLTGMITGFLTQGYSPVEAAKLGVFLHGLAGDFADEEMGLSGLTAIDILENIPNALRCFEL